MMGTGARFEGFGDAVKQLNNLKRATATSVGRRALEYPAEMLARGVRRRAAVLTGELRESVDVHKGKTVKGRPQLEVIASDVASVQNEFGNSDMAPQPFFRPEVVAGEQERNDTFAVALQAEVDAAVARVAARGPR